MCINLENTEFTMFLADCFEESERGTVITAEKANQFGVLFIAGVFIYNIYRARSENKEVSYSKALLISAIIWTKMPYGEWLIFVFVLLAFLEYQAKLPLEIGFSPKQVVFNSLIRKRYAWSDLTNVLLKDGLLTVDFQNNKLFQKLVDDGENEATEEEFNDWCRKHLVHG